MTPLKLALLTGTFLISLSAQPFTPSCKVPFDSIKTEGLDVDARCSLDGNGTTTGKQLESNAKNFFCAPAVPVPITFSTFTKLQLATDGIDHLRKKLDDSRDDLKDPVKVKASSVGEGSRVQFVGILFDAHPSNAKKPSGGKKPGELVNCNVVGEEHNDIHIQLMNKASEQDECQSVTAEMSPHFRPEAWSDLAGRRIVEPVRVTGHLFFDGSHTPCKNGKGSPKRISVWEIHPVYAFDVCTSKNLATCRKNIANESFWIPLDKFPRPEDETEQDHQN
jgi:hypothetical protein